MGMVWVAVRAVMMMPLVVLEIVVEMAFFEVSCTFDTGAYTGGE